jgi:hypothetical protein
MSTPAQSADVESSPGDHRCCCRRPIAGRNRPRLRRVPRVGEPPGRPLPHRRRRRVRTTVPPPPQLTGRNTTAGRRLIIELRQRLARAGLDAGPATIAWHLQHHHQVTVSVATIARTLTRQGLVTPAPKKRPKASYIRFEAAMPNETWQSDFTHYRLTDGTDHGTDVEIITWLDDHSRYVLHCTAHKPVTAKIVLATFRTTVATHGSRHQR